jgi:hypothetical protein
VDEKRKFHCTRTAGAFVSEESGAKRHDLTAVTAAREWSIEYATCWPAKLISGRDREKQWSDVIRPK